MERQLGEVPLDPKEVARAAIEIASEKQAENIVMLDIRAVAAFADYFVIMSAGTSRQISALQNDLEVRLEGAGASFHHKEGKAESGWVLLDFSDVIIHIFDQDQREHYQLESLWSEAVQVVTVL
jgi:ribosome-associated protein